jgi:universal stress protein A
MSYQHVLCAVDLSDDNLAVAVRAAELARHDNARLSLIHVVEYVPIDLANELVLPHQQEIEEQLLKRAKKLLGELAGEMGLDEVSEIIVSGQTRSEIIQFARDHEVDLIVMGKHRKHGIFSILGSTANGVLHHAPCDILIVHIGE